jgi:hypothetical protein
MKTLDEAKARRLINTFADLISTVDAGLVEDWSPTAATIWSHDQPEEFTFEDAYTRSTWATPVLHVSLKDSEKEFWIACFEGESEDNAQSSVFASTNLARRFFTAGTEVTNVLTWDESSLLKLLQ